MAEIIYLLMYSIMFVIYHLNVNSVFDTITKKYNMNSIRVMSRSYLLLIGTPPPLCFAPQNYLHY